MHPSWFDDAPARVAHGDDDDRNQGELQHASWFDLDVAEDPQGGGSCDGDGARHTASATAPPMEIHDSLLAALEEGFADVPMRPPLMLPRVVDQPRGAAAIEVAKAHAASARRL